jgi:hypothetical protein
MEHPKPVGFIKSVTGLHMGPPLSVDTDVPANVKDTIILHFDNDESQAAKELGHPSPETFGPPTYELALQVPDARRIVLSCLHFLADAGDEVAKKMLDVMTKGDSHGDDG